MVTFLFCVKKPTFSSERTEESEGTMTVKAILETALENGAKALDENQSKQILAQYGVPVIRETVARTPEEAARTARELGFPAVVKGLSSQITHKTEAGLVAVGIASADEARNAASAMLKKAGGALSGFLVQPMLRGKREFVCGMHRDPQFGPVVMFGLGGTFAEALSDTSFRLAPLTRADALEMLDEIRGRALLGAFRGERPVNRDALADTLLGLSRLAVEEPLVAEVDVNPLLADQDGNPCAVDALIIPRAPQERAGGREPVPPEAIGALFYPKSIAFVGASAQFGKWGHLLFTNVAGNGFQGDLWLVNAKGGQIARRPAYPSVLDIPGPVDLGVVTVPAESVAGLIPQFAQKGIKNMLLITSGFGETGAEGKALEEELEKQAKDAGVLILGPNTMGISNPHISLFCTGSHVHPQPGSVALVAQSGNMGTQLMAFAQKQGIGIRAFAGTGNEAMVTIEDFIEGLKADRETKAVVLYLESVKDGPRFFKNARTVGKTKPILVLKGGRTGAGQAAAASHTGAMATDGKVFSGACRQAGIVQVETPMDLLDLSAAFSSQPLPRGKRVGIVTLGGGWGVVCADLCAEAGLEVPRLPPEIVAAIDPLLPPFWSRGNPVDLVGTNRMETFLEVASILMRWEGIDALVSLGVTGRRIAIRKNSRSALAADPDVDAGFIAQIQDLVDGFEDRYVAHLMALAEEHGKPVFGVGLLSGESEKTVREVPGAKHRAVFFETPERAARALAGMARYRSFLSREEGNG